MSMEQILNAQAEISESDAYKTVSEFFDENSFCELDAFAKSGDSFVGAVAGFGTVDGMPVYAFAQNSGSDGAMSKAQTAKIKKLYSLALKTGAPVVGFYDSVGGYLRQGSELLGGIGEVLRLSAKVSGVVPQISVVLGNCLGTNALAASNADFIIMTKDAKLSLDVTGENSSSEYNAKNGSAAFVCDDAKKAIAQARELVCYLPSNNLTSAPAADEAYPDGENGKCIVSKIVDGGSKLRIGDAYGDSARIRLARMGGQAVGVVRTLGGKMDAQSAEKAAKFVRFCDAFSIPVITFADCTGFESLASAAKLTSAYAEATTVKISVVTGCVIGSAYIALAGTGANADMVYALPDAVISPVGVEAAAFIMAPEKMKVPVPEQAKAAQQFARENLSAFNAAQNGYVDGIFEEQQLRGSILSALDMLAGKRVPTVAKKHSTV